MFCSRCGNQIKECDKFCSMCGEQVKIQFIKKKMYDTIYEHETNRNSNDLFMMRIEETFSITGRGMVVTGIVQKKNISVNDSVMILNEDGNVIKRNVIIAGIEHCKKLLDSATPNMVVGLLLRGVMNFEIYAGCTLVEEL